VKKVIQKVEYKEINHKEI